MVIRPPDRLSLLITRQIKKILAKQCWIITTITTVYGDDQKPHIKIEFILPVEYTGWTEVDLKPGGTPYMSHIGICPPPQRVGFLRRFGLKTVINFAHFGLESGMVFEGTTGWVYKRIYHFNSKWVRKKWILRNHFCWCSNLNNDHDDIIS